MIKEDAIELLKIFVKNENLIKHCIATGAVMKNLAKKLGFNELKWELAGILHDIDVELTKDNPSEHTKKAVEILTKNNIDNDIIEAIKMHNWEVWGYKSDDVFHIALRAAETITGLIVASTLVLPDKKLSSLTADSVMKRFKDKRFAQGAKREIILECEQLGIPLKSFIELSISSMQGISKDLEL
ncbi:MAG: HDIG domain-containing protein [Elusimicrobiales bacterium]|nr:HDIG domain-containing protein [Elusimicrobiales bacterium]